jgi:acyl-CoA synthetase (AMP-forming)/AMP-acid ligase II
MGAMDSSDLLATAARRDPRHAAVLCGDRRLTYPELERLSRRMAATLLAAGSRPGDRIAAFFPNCHLFMAAYFATLGEGLILVPMNLRLHPREVGAILEHTGARAAIAPPGLMPEGCGPVRDSGEGWAVALLRPSPGAAEAPAPPEETAQLYYTSGTTGRPKGVVLTRGNVAAHVAMTLHELRFDASDVWLHAAPMFHLADAWAVFTATAAGATHVMLPRFDPEAALRALTTHGVTLTNLVPAMLPGLLDAAAARPDPPARLRLLLSGGAPIAPRLVSRIESVLRCDYAQTYGLTETAPFLTFSLLSEAQRRDLPAGTQQRLRARTGRPAQGVTLRVVTPPSAERFEDVPADDRSVGEVVARGATITPGYWRDPEATSAAFRGGWFHTGDLGTIDAHGFLNLVDRAKDAIVTGGEIVYCIEVENALLDHPAVSLAVVFGVPDDRWGEAVHAAVVLVPGSDTGAAQLIAFCRDRIAAYKCPRAVEIVADLPRTGSGKIDKKAMRAPHWAGRERRIN